MALRALAISFALASVGCEGCDCGSAGDGRADSGTSLAEVGADGPAVDEMPSGFEVLGTALGTASRSDVAGWTDALGIPCSQGIDDSGTRVFECRDIDGPIPFVGRSHGGELTRAILEVRTDDVLSSLSVRRRHTSVEQGFADYSATTAEIEERIGAPPVVTGEFNIEDGTTEPARQTSKWTTSVIATEVEVLRGMGPAVMVTESWRWRPLAR